MTHNNYSFLYNYFIIKKNISINNLENNENIFKIKIDDEISILNKFRLDIENYIVHNKISNNDLKIIEKFEILKYLSDNYFEKNILKGDIELFCEELLSFKYAIIIMNEKINSFFTEKISYTNPIKIKNKHLFLKNDLLKKNINMYENSEKIRVTLDILTEGGIINKTLPSLGTVKNFVNFIDFLVNNKKINENILHKLAFNNLEIYKKISQCLLDISDNNLYNFNKNMIENMIENMIKNIDINFENIYYVNKKINSLYIIPYYIDTKKNEINYIDKNELNKIKKYEDLIKHNNKLFLYVTNNIYVSTKEESIKNLDKKNYKNVLACYLFYIINIYTSILMKYVDSVDMLLKDILESKEDRFKILNIKSAFDYTSLLQKSILKFKYILFNNFLNLFRPSKFLAGNYGMKVDENKCYSPESIFWNSNEYIIDNYPFKDGSKYNDKNDALIININKDKLQKFITTIENKSDIYKSDFLLEFGGEVFDNETMEESINILKEYYKLLLLNNNFVLFIIEIIINYFKLKNMPYNFIEDIEIYKSIITNSRMNNNIRSNIEKILIKKYELNIEKCVNNSIKYYDLKKKMNKSELIDLTKFYSKRDLYYLEYTIFYLKSKIIFLISDKYITDIKLKNYLLKKYTEIKKKYTSILKKKYKKI